MNPLYNSGCLALCAFLSSIERCATAAGQPNIFNCNSSGLINQMFREMKVDVEEIPLKNARCLVGGDDAVPAL
jgi:hypothetical protein